MAVIQGGANVQPARLGFHTLFEQEILAVKRGGGAVTGATGDRNMILVPGSGRQGDQPVAVFEEHIKGAGQTIILPVLGADGLDVSLDQTNTEGVELVIGGLTARNPFCHAVGTDRGCFMEVLVKVADVSGANPFLIGFRKNEAFQADEDDYDELAAIGIHGTDGSIKIQTILNNGATTSTDTTQDAADGTAFRLGIFISPAGVVTYQVDRATPTATAAFTFDSGEVLLPFIYFLHAADVAGTVELQELTLGVLN